MKQSSQQNILSLPRWYTKLFLGNLFGFFLAGAASITIAFLDLENWTGNFWLWRSPVSIPGTIGHHVVIEFIEIFTLWFLIRRNNLQTPGGNRLKSLFLEKRGFLDACISLFFIMGVHETLYYPFYIARYGVNPLMIPTLLDEVPYIRNFWIVVGPSAIAAYVIWKLYLWKDSPNFPSFNREILFVAAVAGFYLIHLSLGFPITLDYSGLTQWIANPFVNSIEITGWGWACFAYCYLVKA